MRTCRTEANTAAQTDVLAKHRSACTRSSAVLSLSSGAAM
jgi:hypothetical protein